MFCGSTWRSKCPKCHVAIKSSLLFLQGHHGCRKMECLRCFEILPGPLRLARYLFQNQRVECGMLSILGCKQHMHESYFMLDLVVQNSTAVEGIPQRVCTVNDTRLFPARPCKSNSGQRIPMVTPTLCCNVSHDSKFQILNIRAIQQACITQKVYETRKTSSVCQRNTKQPVRQNCV